MRIFLAGDVMTGRGVDQILPHPCDPRLHEDGARSALDYVALAEWANGAIGKPASFAYVWGAALEELARQDPDLRLVNLETSVTHSDARVPKSVNYRMSPENAPCLAAAGINCCALANNHVLDWGRTGLLDTLDALERSSIKAAGAGRDRAQAFAPAVLDAKDKGRAAVFSFASPSSGVPLDWAATNERPGVAFLPDLDRDAIELVGELVAGARRESCVAIVSLHYGPNWGYEVEGELRRFAHAVIDAGAAILHCHSSHHFKGIEVYENRPILYGCGDFLNDYEGIGGYEAFRSDLVLMYVAELEPSSGRLRALEMTPFRIKKLSLARPSRPEVEWVAQTLDRESRRFGARVELDAEQRLALSW